MSEEQSAVTDPTVPDQTPPGGNGTESGAPADTSNDEVSISGTPEPATNATEPVAPEAAAVGAEGALPPVPEGVVVEPRAEVAFDPALPDGTLELSFEEVPSDEREALSLRFLGSDIGPELDFVSPEPGTATFSEVMVQLVDAALEGLGDSDEPITGQKLAAIFCRGDVEDERVAFLLLLLAQDQPITGELVLEAARSQGYEQLVDQAILSREELERVGDVAVEQMTATGFVSLDGEREPRGPVEAVASASPPLAPALAARKPSAAPSVEVTP